jgi:hypothetical protein
MFNFGKYSYQKEFKRAVKRTTKLGLTAPEVAYEGKRYWNPQTIGQLPTLIHHVFPQLDVPDIVGRCHHIHKCIHKPLEDLLGCRAYFTIGSVSIPGDEPHLPRKEAFKMSEAEVRHYMEEGAPDLNHLNIHAWLTLDSMEVFDMTYPTTVGFSIGNKEMMGGIITCHLNDLNSGLQYHPFVVGSDLLKKMGLMFEFAIL